MVCFDDVERGGVAGLVDGHQDAALPVHAHDIGLRRESVADVGHIANIDASRRWLVLMGRSFSAAMVSVEPFICDVVFGGTELDGAGGERQILRADGVDHVNRRQALGLQRGDIHVDGDLRAAFRHKGQGIGYAGNGGQLVADEVRAEIEQLLFGKALSFQCQVAKWARSRPNR